MTTYNEYGTVTPVRRPDWGTENTKQPKMSTGYPALDETPIPGPSPMPTSPFGQQPKMGTTMVPTPIPGPSPSPTSPFGPPIKHTSTPPAPTPTPTPTPQPTPGPIPGAPTPPTYPNTLGLDFMRNVTPNELVANQLQSLLGSNSPYVKNARLRGAEYANSRGNINSSIGAGASQRAAIEAAMPIAQADADVYREANRGNFESLSQLRQMRTAADLENWLSSESYTRDFNGRLAMMPIQSSFDMMQYVAQRALEDPAVYTPDVISGFNNFFNANMFDIFNTWFGGPPGGG